MGVKGLGSNVFFHFLFRKCECFGSAMSSVLFLFSEPYIENFFPAFYMPYVRFIKISPKIIRKCQVAH